MSTQNSEKREIKIVLLSDPGTGVKTSLAARYVDDMFEKETVPTLGVNMRRKSVTVDGTEATLMIWGLAHQNMMSTVQRTLMGHNTWTQTHRERSGSGTSSRHT